jgi:hypothetical protein
VRGQSQVGQKPGKRSLCRRKPGGRPTPQHGAVGKAQAFFVAQVVVTQSRTQDQMGRDGNRKGRHTRERTARPRVRQRPAACGRKDGLLGSGN